MDLKDLRRMERKIDERKEIIDDIKEQTTILKTKKESGEKVLSEITDKINELGYNNIDKLLDSIDSMNKELNELNDELEKEFNKLNKLDDKEEEQF